MNFVISGELEKDNNMIKRLMHMIASLKGHVLTNYLPSCTHVIVLKFAATEKIMSGLASGIWLINKNFVEDSFKEGRWLSEQIYEIKHWNYVAKYHRSREPKELYKDKSIYVCSKMANSMIHQKVIAAGGGTICTRKDLPTQSIDFALCDLKSACDSEIIHSIKPILKLEYIMATIFKRMDPNNLEPFYHDSPKENIKIESQCMIQIKEEENEFHLCDSKSLASKKTRGRNKIPFTPTKYQTITKYFKASPKKSLLLPSPNDAENDEVKILKEIRKVPLKEKERKEKETIEIVSSDSEIEEIAVKNHNDLNKSDLELQKISPQELVKDVQSQSDSFPQLVANSSNKDIHSEPNNTADVSLGTMRDIENKVKDQVSTQSNSSDMQKTDKIPQSKSFDQSISFETLSQEIRLGNFNKNLNRLNEFKKAILILPFHAEKAIITEHRRRIYSSYYFLLKVDHISYTSPEIKKAFELPLDDNLLFNKSVGLESYKTTTTTTEMESNEFIEATLLECLKLSIREGSYPNSKVLAEVLKKYFFQPTKKVLRTAAIELFKKVLLLHPPRTTSLRNYYLDVFSHAVTTSEMCRNKNWYFIRHIIEQSVRCAQEGSESLLHHILPVFYQDMKYFNEKPVSVHKLLSYRLFWSHPEQRPSLLNESVKEFIKIWVQSATQPPLVRDEITNLFSVMMEILWKHNENKSAFSLSYWPLNESWMKIVGEIYNQFQALEDHEALFEMVQECHIPWQRMLYSSLIFRILEPLQHKTTVSISSLKVFLKKEAEKCPQNSDSMGRLKEHTFLCELLSAIHDDYMQAIGGTFFLDSLGDILRYSMMEEEDIVHFHQPRSSGSHKNEKASKYHGNDKPSASHGSSNKRSSSNSIPDAKRSSNRSTSDSGDGFVASTVDEQEVEDDEDFVQEVKEDMRLMENECKRSIAWRERLQKKVLCPHLEPLFFN